MFYLHSVINNLGDMETATVQDRTIHIAPYFGNLALQDRDFVLKGMFRRNNNQADTVSYTHLTLPTKA